MGQQYETVCHNVVFIIFLSFGPRFLSCFGVQENLIVQTSFFIVQSRAVLCYVFQSLESKKSF